MPHQLLLLGPFPNPLQGYLIEQEGAICLNPPCYILEEIEWTGVVEVGPPLVCGWLGYGLD
jgi:hypothetical protein